MMYCRRGCLMIVLALAVCVQTGCQAPDGRMGKRGALSKHRGHGRIKHVRCLYDQKPWLNLDLAGDRDPEGIHYRVFLDAGTGPCVLREGTFHIEMYQLARDNKGVVIRTLISDWHYPTSGFTIVDSKLLGMGYHLQLRWHGKEFASREIELITRFEDANGLSARSGTKRFQIPKYAS